MVDVVEINCSGIPVAITVRASKRSKRCKLRALASQIELVHPSRWSRKTALQFAESNASWILTRHLEHLRREATSDPNRILIRGDVYHLEYQDLARVVHESERRVLIGKDRTAIKKWLRDLASRELARVLAEEAARMQLTYSRLTVRDQTSRWGSCSTRGSINLNWRLIMAPDWAMRYVVIHELGHIRHPNHSREFWSYVNANCDQVSEAETWLKQHQHELMSALND